MKHSKKLKNEDKIIKKITSLRYDTLSEFLENFSMKFFCDAMEDHERGRHKLGCKLSGAGYYIKKAKEEIDKAWEICKPYMKEKIMGV